MLVNYLSSIPLVIKKGTFIQISGPSPSPCVVPRPTLQHLPLIYQNAKHISAQYFLLIAAIMKICLPAIGESFLSFDLSCSPLFALGQLGEMFF